MFGSSVKICIFFLSASSGAISLVGNLFANRIRPGDKTLFHALWETVEVATRKVVREEEEEYPAAVLFSGR